MAKSTPTLGGTPLAVDGITQEYKKFGTLTTAADGTTYWTQRGTGKHVFTITCEAATLTEAAAIKFRAQQSGVQVFTDEEGYSYNVVCTDAPYSHDVEQSGADRMYSVTLTLTEV